MTRVRLWLIVSRQWKSEPCGVSSASLAHIQQRPDFPRTTTFCQTWRGSTHCCCKIGRHRGPFHVLQEYAQVLGHARCETCAYWSDVLISSSLLNSSELIVWSQLPHLGRSLPGTIKRSERTGGGQARGVLCVTESNKVYLILLPFQFL